MQFLKDHSKLLALAILVICGIYAISSYNGLVSLDENVQAKWSEVEVQYQRRADLIPNLVNTVKGYATHEQETFEKLTAMRAKAFQNVQSGTPSAEELKSFEESQGMITAALGRLIAVAENYPELKANQNFLELQAQLEGTENRIAVARRDFNNTVQVFNQTVRRFPGNILASLLGFNAKAYLQAQEKASQSPVVSF